MTDIDPGNFDFGWQAFSMELKAQISKKLLIYSLGAGMAGSYSLYATAYTGVKVSVPYLSHNLKNGLTLVRYVLGNKKNQEVRPWNRVPRQLYK